MQKGIVIGRSGAKPISFILETLLRTRLLIQANSGGGKSWLIRLLCELIFGKVQIILIDREGEFASLRPKYGFLHVGQVDEGADIQADVRSARLLAEKLLEFGTSAICDLYEAFRTNPSARRAWVAAFLEGLIDAPKHLWHDCIVIVDEAHQFCPQESPKAASMLEREIISRCKEAMVALATVGRKRGLCAVWATQRLAKLDKDASAELFNRLVGMTIEDVDVDRATDLMSVSREDKPEFRKTLRELEPGNFFAFGRAIVKERTLFKVDNVTTKHQEAGSKGYSSKAPPVPEVIRKLLPKLADLPKEVDTRAKSEKQLRAEIQELHKKIAILEKVKPVSAPPPVKTVTTEKTVEVPVIGKRQARALVKAAEKSLSAAEAITKFAGMLNIDRWINDLKNVASKVGDPSKLLQTLPPSLPPKLAIVPKVERKVHVERPSVAPTGVPLDKGLKAVLSVLAHYPEGCEIGKLALLSGYCVSGGFRNTLADARTFGYMEGPNTGTMKITDAGRAVVPDPERLEGKAFVDYWLGHRSFGVGERKTLQALLLYPEGLMIEDLAAASGYEVSGGFRNILSTLRTAGVLAGRNTEKMRPSDELLGALSTAKV